MIDQIKQNIKKQIKLHNTTAIKVCKKIGEDRRFIFFLTDKTSLIKIMRIAKGIGCEPGDLLNGVTLPKPYDN